MQTVRIEDFRGHAGEEVIVRGWIHNKRSSGKLQFLIVRDGSGYAQAVISKKAVPPEAWDALDAAGQESSLEITGVVRQHPKRSDEFEIGVTDFLAVPYAVGSDPRASVERTRALLVKLAAHAR